MTNVQHAPRSGKPRSDGVRRFAPRMPAGYSGTPLPRKLGIKDASDVALVSAPDEFERLLDAKRASGMATDLTENVIRDVGLGHGLVDNKVCAIDQTWSGLRFVRRLADR